MSARKPPYPKLWNGPNPIGESQIRYMDTVGLPYMTKSGPGFMARKKGPFVEVTGTTTITPVLPFIRASESTDATRPSVAVTSADGSLQFSKVMDGGSVAAKVKRTSKPYYPTINWISADQKTVVTWRSPSRYERTRLTGYSSASFIPGLKEGSKVFGFGVSSSYPYDWAVWVNGVRYQSSVIVLGACVFVDQMPGGVEARYLKIIGSREKAQMVTDSSGYTSINESFTEYANTLEFIPLDKNGIYKKHSFITGDSGSMNAEEARLHSLYTHRPFHFNASGTEAVCTGLSGALLDEDYLLDGVRIQTGTPGIIVKCPGTEYPQTVRLGRDAADSPYPYIKNVSKSTRLDQPGGDNSNGSFNSDESAQVTLYTSFDYLLGTDELTYVKRVMTTTSSKAYEWTSIIGPGPAPGTAGVQSKEFSSSYKYSLGGTDVQSCGGGLHLGSFIINETTDLDVDRAEQHYWTEDGYSHDDWTSTGRSVRVNQRTDCLVTPIDMRVGAILRNEAVTNISLTGTKTNTKAGYDTHPTDASYAAFPTLKPPRNSLTMPHGGVNELTHNYKFSALLPTQLGGVGSDHQLGSWSKQMIGADTSDGLYLVGAELAIDPKSGNIVSSMYRYGNDAETQHIDFTTFFVNAPRLQQVATYFISREQSGEPGSLTFTYAPYSVSRTPGTTLTGLAFAHKPNEGFT